MRLNTLETIHTSETMLKAFKNNVDERIMKKQKITVIRVAGALDMRAGNVVLTVLILYNAASFF